MYTNMYAQVLLNERLNTYKDKRVQRNNYNWTHKYIKHQMNLYFW